MGRSHAGDGKVALEFWYEASWDGEARGYEAVKAFEKDNPDIAIKGTAYGGTAILDALHGAAADGTGPDVYFIWLGYQQWPLADAGFTLDLTPYDRAYAWSRKLKKGAMDGVTHNGRIWGVPYNLWSLILWARKDLLDAYNGGRIPQTMDELRAWGDRLHADGKRLAAASSLDGWQLLRYTQAFIGNCVGNDSLDMLLNLEGSWDTPHVARGLAELKLWCDKYFQPGFGNIRAGDAVREFCKGNAAVILESSWMHSSMKDIGHGDLEVVGFPVPADGKPWRLDSFPEQISVTTRCRHPDAAVRFADYIARLETQHRFAARFDWSPAAVGYEFGADKPMHRRVADLQGMYGSTPPWDGGLPMAFDAVIYEVQDAVAAGTMTPEQGARRLQQGMEACTAGRKRSAAALEG